MRLVLAEKPDLGRAIAAAILPNGRNKGSYIEGDGMIITWAFGHLFKLKSPEEYRSELKKWDLNALPIFFDNWGIVPDNDKTKQIYLIRDFLKEADTVIHAGDPDDEGQLLIDEILDYFDYQGKVLRLSTNDLTASVIQKAYENMVDNEKMRPLGEAARARSVADFTVGINYSRFFTLKNRGSVLSVGRVQSPTLGMVVARDALIDGHQKVLFYEGQIVTHIVPDFPTTLKLQLPEGSYLLDENKRVIDKDALSKILEGIRNKTLNADIMKSIVKEKPPLPFNLTKLQTSVFQRYAYSPEETLSITQSLREKHHLITYNRSTCQYLNDEQFDEAPKVVSSILANVNAQFPQLSLDRRSDAFNSKKVGESAHTGIIPTSARVDLSTLSEKERNVYKLIAAQYLAQFMPLCVKEITKVSAILPDNMKAIASETRIIEKGYRIMVPKKEKIEDSNLCTIPEGLYNDCVIEETLIKEKETKPPARYNLASLGEDMTRVSKYVSDPTIKRLLIAKDDGKEGENGSIGTPATRDTIVKTLIKRGFLEVKGGKVYSTKLGRDFYEILPDEVKKPDLTAKWWAICEDIKSGAAKPEVLYQSVLQSIHALLESGYTGGSIEVEGHSNSATIGSCPLCGREIRMGNNGAYCTGYKDSVNQCNFKFYQVQYGKKLTEKQLLTLISKKSVVVRGLKSKSTGRFYDAKLSWSGEVNEKGFAVLNKPSFETQKKGDSK